MPQRVYLCHDGERHEYFIKDGATVADVRREVKNTYLLGGDDGKPDKKVVILNFQGAELEDDWRFQDIGVLPGSTIRIGEREEKRPRLHLDCIHSGELVKVMDDIDFLRATVSELRTIASRKTGLPVGVFRLTSPDGQEMFDCNTLDNYGIRMGDTLALHTWDGWTDFLNVCAQGHTTRVLANLSDDELVAKYQMKVAMHMGCHFGHIDLVTTLMKHGARADDPVGYHPRRLWCLKEPHIESLRPPIHVAGVNGHLNLLRAIVNYNICSISCKDGNDKTPFQVALMGKQKPCAGYLLGKQWSRIAYGPPQLGITLPLNIYAHLKNWCERARDRNYLLNGPSKSTLKRKPYIKMDGTLVGLGVIVDGFSSSQMNGKDQPDHDRGRSRSTFLILPEDKRKPDPKTYFKQVLHSLTSKANRAAAAAARTKPSIKPAARNARTESVFDDVALPAAAGDDDDASRREQASRYPIGTRAGQLEPPSGGGGSNAREATRRPTYVEFDQIGESDETRCESRSASKLPPIGFRQSQARSEADEVKDDCFIETGKDNTGSKQKKGGAAQKSSAGGSPPVKKSKIKSVDYGIPLPLIKAEPAPRKFIVTAKSFDEDPAMSALTAYEKHRGLNARDYAIKCLSIANNFKEKPWLQQVRLAMELTAQEVKKQLKEKGH